MAVRLAIFEVWAFVVGRKSATQALEGVRGVRELAETAGARTVAAFRSS